ncbi:23S rRNA methyltransferase (plasmid) [Klebsiella aerogenes]|nr:23S rRNA methyltransferase [Klebsiella aerogenes]
MIFECYQQGDGEKLVRDLPFSSLIFARQMFVVGELLRDLPPEDRITPIVGMLQGVVEKAVICALRSRIPTKAKS